MNKIIKESNKISYELVEQTAKLARISLSKEEINLFQKQLADIIDLFEDIKKVETQGILPFISINEQLSNVFREDEVLDSLSSIDALSSSQMKLDDYFKVPKVL